MKGFCIRKMRRAQLLWLIPALALGGCSQDDSGIESDSGKPGEGSAVFRIETSPVFGIGVSTRAGDETSDGETTREESDPEKMALKNLKFVLADSKGRVIDHHYARMESDFSRLTIEGLKSGRYSIMFLGTVSEGDHARIADPAEVSSGWLLNEGEGNPIDGLYCHKKLDFTIGFDQAPVDQQVDLPMAVARVDVELQMASLSLWRNVKKVSVTFDNEVAGSMNADGSFSGVHTVADYDITDSKGHYTFTSFPNEEPVSGYVEVVSSRDGDDDFSTRYYFKDLRLEAGKISRIEVAYRHPEMESGRLFVAADQMWRFRPDTMFMSDEPREVFYNNSRRSFYVNAPLQISVAVGGNLLVKLYSPKKVRNVKVMGRFRKISSEWVELAYFEEVPEFVEGYFPLPIAEKECIFTTTSGRIVRIPAQKNLKSDDVEIRFETDDEFMKKISTIEAKWYIRFSAYGADNGHAYWRHMDPMLCRHGVALALNMAYMFASPEFSAELDTYDGILFDNGKNPINLDALRTKIRNHGGLMLGRVVGVGGLGGGQTYGLADYCYTGVYHDATAPESNPHNYPRQAMFHEYGHCLGYSHDSNMTYGDKWTVLCAKVFVQLGKEGKLPVSNRTDVTSLPFER